MIFGSFSSCSFRELSSIDIYEKHKSAVVLVRTYDHRGELLAHGTGFSIEPKGTIVTNHHVIEDAYLITVDFGDQIEHQVQGYLGYNKVADLIALNIFADEAKLPTIHLGDSPEVQIGEDAYVIGNPLGVFEKSFSSGAISQILESKESDLPEVLYQLTAPVSPGSSGSPVFNKHGVLIAVIMASVPFQFEAQNINFAVPVCYIKPLLVSGVVYEMEAPNIYEKIKMLQFEATDNSLNENYIEAINLYTEIIKLDPYNSFGFTADAYSDRSYQYTLLGLNEKALQDINKAIELKPDLAGLYNDRGCILQDMDRHGDAIMDFSIAMELDPEYVHPYSNRGNAYYNLGLYEQAINDYTKSIDMRLEVINIEASPDDLFYGFHLWTLSQTANIYYFRGLSYWELGQVNKAVDDFIKALELDPDYGYAREALRILKVPGY